MHSKTANNQLSQPNQGTQTELKKYKLLIMSGCSGVGKGTLINYLLNRYPSLFQLSVSLTTRNPRQGQLDGRQYHFVTIQEFKKQIQNDVFAEFCQVHGNYYGTHEGKLNQVINKGKVKQNQYRFASWTLICREDRKFTKKCQKTILSSQTLLALKIYKKDQEREGLKVLSRYQKDQKMQEDSWKQQKGWHTMSTQLMEILRKLKETLFNISIKNTSQTQKHDGCIYQCELFKINKMNRIFGFFKQKITEVKQENKQELQTIANAFNESQYSTQKVLTLLQSIKSNYMNWNILIANEASTGLYYSQLHNRNICLRKIKGNEEQRKQMQKNKMKLSHIKDTVKQLKQISQLNDKWMNSINANLEGINAYLTYMKKKANSPEQAQRPQILNEPNLKQSDGDKKSDEKEKQLLAQNIQKQQKEQQIKQKLEQICDDQ